MRRNLTRIDAHHHLWRYNDADYVWMSGDMGTLRRDFLLPELEQVLTQSGVEGAVTVQARQTLAETRWLLELARTAGSIRGVVGWVPLVRADLRQSLDELAGDLKLKGVRHVVHDEPDDNYILRDDFNNGIALLKDYGLAYDILIFERHLPQTLAFIDRHPNQIFVVDHIAKPRIRERVLSPWRELLRDLARRENVYCKISGMVTEADWHGWTPASLAPYFDMALSAFHAKRLMFGSDWPVLNLAADYPRWVEAVDQWLQPLSESERSRIWGQTAVEAYCLDKRRS